MDTVFEYQLNEYGVFQIVFRHQGEQMLIYAEAFERVSYIRQANRTTPKFVFYWGDQPLRNEPFGCSDLFAAERLLGTKGEPIGFRYTCDDQVDQLLSGPGYHFPEGHTNIPDWNLVDFSVDIDNLP